MCCSGGAVPLPPVKKLRHRQVEPGMYGPSVHVLCTDVYMAAVVAEMVEGSPELSLAWSLIPVLPGLR